jgi:2-polyprenyl-3-methyl-5-hydroxy-6-metoxy-1,4-benzoquinol methylase
MSTIPLGAKPGDYYGLGRDYTIRFLPRPVGRVLDVGCGEGGAAGPLREAGATYIAGIELLAEPAAAARERYDQVVVGDAIEAVGELSGEPFDTVLCYDVIEHLYDPGALLRELTTVTRPGGFLHVSVPNARHVSLFRDLFVRGTFGYQEQGHRDATHLRWFTRRDIEALVRESGWEHASTGFSQLHKSRALHRLTRGRTTEFLAGQWYVLGQKPHAGSS